MHLWSCSQGSAVLDITAGGNMTVSVYRSAEVFFSDPCTLKSGVW